MCRIEKRLHWSLFSFSRLLKNVKRRPGCKANDNTADRPRNSFSTACRVISGCIQEYIRKTFSEKFYGETASPFGTSLVSTSKERRLRPETFSGKSEGSG
jgi:uncharacterized protein (DUF362 family)